MILTLLQIDILIVYIIDISGFTSSWKELLSKWLGVKVGKVKPFDCSLCMTFWVNAIVSLCMGGGMYGLFISAILSYMADIMAEVLPLVKQGMRAILDLLWRIINFKH